MKATAVVFLCAALVRPAPAAARDDPWAPGASLAPWALIGHIQAFPGTSGPEPDWERAVRHDEPLVRAAAAAALGRAPAAGRRAWLDLLLDDRVPLVRHTAHWAALQQEGEPSRDLVERVLAEPRAHHEVLADVIPPGVQSGTSQGREWLAGLPPGPVPRRATGRPRQPPRPERITVFLERSEYDGDEVVEVTARVDGGPGTAAYTWHLPATLQPHDPWRPIERPAGRAGANEAPLQPVTMRVVGGDGSPTLAVVPGTSETVVLAFDLEDVPPDVYTLDVGYPVFLRVRRSPAAEVQGTGAASSVLDSDAALAIVTRLRMLSAAPALRRRFAESLAAYGYGFNAWSDTVALARLGDPDAADLVLPPLLAAREFSDPYTGEAPDIVWLLTHGFGGAARGRIPGFVSDWSGALEAGSLEPLSTFLADRAYGLGSPVDDARVDVLRRVGPPTGATAREEYRLRKLVEAAMAGAAPDHPAEVAAQLARHAAQAGHLVGQLQRVSAGLSGGSLKRLVWALWAALPPGVPDARAAVGAEAERLGVALPANAGAALPSAQEMERQLLQARGHGSTPALVDGILDRARELLAREKAPLVALLAAEAEMERGRFDEAARLVPDPISLTAVRHSGTSPAGRAFAVRGRVAAAHGRLAEAARELAAAGQAAGSRGRFEPTKGLAERIEAIGVDPPASVRFLPYPFLLGHQLSLEGRASGSHVFWVAAGNEVRRFDPRTGESLVIGVAPGPVRRYEPVGPETVIVAGSDAVWRLDAGRSGATWTQPITPHPYPSAVELAADEGTTVVKDGAGRLRAWSTASPAEHTWQVDGVAQFALAGEGAGGVLVLPPLSRGGPSRRLRRLDAVTGREDWSEALAAAPLLWTVASGLAIVWMDHGTMAAYDLRDGRQLWRRGFGGPNLQGLAINRGIEFVVARDRRRVYLRIGSVLHGLSAQDGRTLWRVPFEQSEEEAADTELREHWLVPVSDGSVWWTGPLKAPFRTAAARLVDREGVVRLSPRPTGERRAPMAMPDGTLLVPPPHGASVEVWDPR